MTGLYHLWRTGGHAYVATLGQSGIDWVWSHDFDEVDAAHPDHTVTILREPRSRILSEYVYRCYELGCTRIPKPPVPTVSLYEFLLDWEPAYAEAVRRADEVLITERLTLEVEYALTEWPPFDVGASRAALIARLTEQTVEDMAVYRQALQPSGVPDPDVTLEQTLDKFGIR